nr:immunoglobulin light chain junction region [Macaca mulatta]MOV83689.1 immunoglobulin light chain junction region [Macaca mulatta]
CLQYKTYPFTF